MVGNKKVCELNKITKKFGKTVALKDVSLSIYENNIYGLIGSNGAGKTTLIRLLAKLLFANQGDIILFDKNIKEEKYDAQKIGFLIENPTLLNEMTAFENLSIFGSLKSC